MAMLSEELQKELEEAAYLVVGLGVLAFQSAQVRRRELDQQVRSFLKNVAARP